MTRENHPFDSASVVRGLKQRDPQAIAQLYDAYGSLVYSRMYSMVRNEATAEDLVQDVFLRVWTRAHTFDETRGSLCTWILGVARNRAIDYMRSRESQLERKASSLDGNPGFASLLSCENEAVGFDLFGRLRGAFSRLNFNQRTLLELAFQEGLSHSEVAHRLQRPLGTVKTQIRVAIKYLRAEMVECGGKA